MFTVFVDDSGTAPEQKVAIAAALVIPSIQIGKLDSHWDSFRSKYGFTCFHSSVCAHRNPKSDFVNWPDDKIEKAFYRARQIIKQRSCAAFSFAINKSDFDAETPADWRQPGGENHYTWAFRTLMHELIKWHKEHKAYGPFEFVFDWAEDKSREEIEMLMEQFETEYPGWIHGHYSQEEQKGCSVSSML